MSQISSHPWRSLPQPCFLKLQVLCQERLLALNNFQIFHEFTHCSSYGRREQPKKKQPLWSWHLTVSLELEHNIIYKVWPKYLQWDISNQGMFKEKPQTPPLCKVKFRRDMSTGPTTEFCQDSSWTPLEFCTLLHQAVSLAGLGLWCPSVGHRLTFKLCHFTGPDPAGSRGRLLSPFNDRRVYFLLNRQQYTNVKIHAKNWRLQT